MREWAMPIWRLGRRVVPVLLVVGLMVVLGNRLGLLSSRAEDARPLPAPTLDPAAGASTSATIVLAGGCFWGVQGVFQHVEGVESAVSGYAGGARETAEYDRVSGGGTGHAESVRVSFDPRKVSLGKLLQIFFSVVHDPTQLDRQGPDSGPQYRSAIFVETPDQARIAKAYIEQLGEAHAFSRPIVTRIEAGKTFYPAEPYHQDYLTLHPTQLYIAINDLPKVENLKRLFPQVYRADPMLVGRTQ